MAMPSEGCAGAMAFSTIGSVPMSISSQQMLVHAACALAGGGMTPKRSACQSPNAGVDRSAVDVSGNRVHLSFARRIGGVVVVVAVDVLGEVVEGRVEAEEVAVAIGAEHE
eukprot:6177670-Pleurochrysis_carterae.AAC.1